MPTAKASSGAIAGGIVLGALIGLLWTLNLATLASLGNSDAAGNAIGEAWAAIQIIAIWSLLTVLTVVACVKGAAPKAAKAAALVNAYRDSPGKAEMLARLTQLRSMK